MFFETLQTLFCFYVFYVFAIDELTYVNGQVPNEMLEKGKAQYMLLRERGSLPKYGICWTQAVKNLEDGCKQLDEDTQTEIALQFTNCFLEMSGHEIYSCDLNKKPNLRAICINSMSDRAFNVYTEFYTHTQNICWFLQGQIWHETISENTQRVGKQLELSAKIQEELIIGQNKSLAIQNRLMMQSSALERILDNFLMSTKQHQELLHVVSASLNTLQTWILGEISWIETIIFFISIVLIVILFTSIDRTANARLPILFLLSIYFAFERFVCKIVSNSQKNIDELHYQYYQYIWYLRNILICLIFIILVITAYSYKDFAVQNNLLLIELNDRVIKLSETINFTNNNENKVPINRTIEVDTTNTLNSVSNYLKTCEVLSVNENNVNVSIHRQKVKIKPKKTPLTEVQNGYNLRSRQGTPEKN